MTEPHGSSSSSSAAAAKPTSGVGASAAPRNDDGDPDARSASAPADDAAGKSSTKSGSVWRQQPRPSSAPVSFPFVLRVPGGSSLQKGSVGGGGDSAVHPTGTPTASQVLRSSSSREIVSRLTLKEKLELISGRSLWSFGGIDRLDIPELTLADGPHGVRKPLHGDTQLSHEATCFPASCSLACSWDVGLASEVGRALSIECEMLGVSLLLGPGMNLKRHPCGGRNFEYLSEDPYLGGSMASALIGGVQHSGRVGACAKHVAANNQESFRFVIDAVIEERAMRELYMAGFERCVGESQPWALMCAYNKVNGTYCSENATIFRDWMRGECRFGGGGDGDGDVGGDARGDASAPAEDALNPHIVMSDWGAVNDRVMGIKAGLDLEMPGSFGAHDRAIKKALKDGTLKEDQLDECCVRIVQFIQRATTRTATATATAGKGGGGPAEGVGAADAADAEPKTEQEQDRQDRDEESQIPEQQKNSDDDKNDWKERHHSLALRAARESLVLLKNENETLPLRENAGKEKVAIIGKFAERPRYQGSGSSQVNPTRLETVRDLIHDYCAENGNQDNRDRVTFADGYHLDQEGIEESDVDRALLDEAAAAADGADVCLLFVGLPEIAESEGFDRLHLRLPSQHDALVDRVVKACPRTVVVLSNGGPVEMPWADRVPAIVEMYLTGQGGARAVLDALFGRSNPCGKLAETFPLKLDDVLAHRYFPGNRNRVEYAEGLMVGYRYFDSDSDSSNSPPSSDSAASAEEEGKGKGKPVLFPFGHGLSYTTFDLSDLDVKQTAPTEPTGAGKAYHVNVSVTVVNTGDVAGAEVVQCYVSRLGQSEVYRPEQELTAFEKIHLSPGERERANMVLPPRAFAYYDVGFKRWVVEDGEYEIRVGTSSRDDNALRGTIVLETGEQPSDKAIEAYPPSTTTTDPNEDENGNGKNVIHRNSILSECQGSFLGRTLRSVLIKSMETHIESDAAEEKAAKVRAAFADNFPLRGLVLFSSGALTFPVLDWMIDVMNGRYCAAFGGVFPLVFRGRFRN